MAMLPPERIPLPRSPSRESRVSRSSHQSTSTSRRSNPSLSPLARVRTPLPGDHGGQDGGIAASVVTDGGESQGNGSAPSSRRTSSSTRYTAGFVPGSMGSAAADLRSSMVFKRPSLDRNATSATVRQVPQDPFYEKSTIAISQPVGSLSISPSSRDVVLASRKGLYILDLANLDSAPRFIPQGGAWQIADCQWSPHPSTSNLILSTSSQKLLIWDLIAQTSLYKSIDAHSRAITDINWHARNPNLMATASMDAGIRGWDLRATDRPVMRLCAWGAAGTQVKWNRQHEHILATSHGKEVNIWDNRKGSVPVTVIRAHDAKIYGIDWDRQWRHKLVTCSLDKTIKFWTVPDLRSVGDSRTDFYESIPAPEGPAGVITTDYPVWRARNLPFGHGVLALPQRGEKALEMFALGGTDPVHRFEGHDDVVKEFVWRTRGGEQADFEDREFQLVTWGKDETLRIWPVNRDMCEKVGYRYGAPIQILVSRRGAPDITYTKVLDSEDKKLLPPPIVNPPSGISKSKAARPEAGMTRGRAGLFGTGGRSAAGGGGASGGGGGSGGVSGSGRHGQRGMDQLDWLTKVMKEKENHSPESSAGPSRIGSHSRRGSSRSVSADGTSEWLSLKDEIVLVNKLFPRPRVNFEKIDLHHRKLTMSMNGPWALASRTAFMRIHWSFPVNYPYASEPPTFELENNPTVSNLTRLRLVTTIKEMRAEHRQCLVATCGFLLGAHERVGRRLAVEEDSDSESERGPPGIVNAPPLMRTSGATFGPNGQLVCFFPKQTVLPRIKAMSRSPSITRERQRNPLVKAMSALSRMENPGRQPALRLKPRLRRYENTAPTVQPGSTCTIHDVSSFLGNPSLHLAKVYSTSLEANIHHAMDAKRLDHADVWSALRGVLEDPPPPYSRHPGPDRGVAARREREWWERSTARKAALLHDIFEQLIAAQDIQMLALVAVAVLAHDTIAFRPPASDPMTHLSPEQDYFALPPRSRPSSYNRMTPLRSRGSQLTFSPHTPYGFGATPPQAPGSRDGRDGSAPGSSSFRASGWSQIFNQSSLSLRTAPITPQDRSSFFEGGKTPYGMSFDDSPAPPPSHPGSGARRPTDSPRCRSDRTASTPGWAVERPRNPVMAPLTSSASPPPVIARPHASSVGSLTAAATVAGQAGGLARASSSGVILPGVNEEGSARTPGTGTSAPSGRIGSNSAPQERVFPLSSGGDRSARVSFEPGSGGVKRNWTKPKLDLHAQPRKAQRTCSVRIQLLTDDSPPPELLPLWRRVQCEAWKLAYADYLLRVGLLGKRAELLQHDFLPGQQEGSAAQAAAGVAGAGDDRDGHHRWSRRNGRMATVCSGCTSALETCPACENKVRRPACSFCRLPIRGLSTTCAVCTHRTHVSCLQKHVGATTKANPTLADETTTCPACPCRCLAEGGLSHATIPFKPSGTAASGSASASASAPRTTRSSVRGTVSPVPPLSPESGHSRLNYSSLANLTGVVQMLGPRERQKLARDSTRVQAHAQANAHHAQIGEQPATAAPTNRAGKPRGGEVLASSPENLMTAPTPASVSVNQTAAAGSSSSSGGIAGSGSAAMDGNDAPGLGPAAGGSTTATGGGSSGGDGGGGHARAEGIWAKARGLTTEGFLTWTRGGDG